MESGDRQMGVKASWAELGALDSSSNPHLIKFCWLSLLNMPYPHQLFSASKALVQSSSQSPGQGPSLLTGFQDPLLPSTIHFLPTRQTIFLKIQIPSDLFVPSLCLTTFHDFLMLSGETDILNTARNALPTLLPHRPLTP